MGKEKIFNKETVQRLRKLSGKARGIHFTLDAQYLKEKEGEQALQKVERVLEKVGCELKYQDIKRLNFYPIEWRAFSLLAMKKALNFSDQDFRELGAYSAKVSLVVRLYLKFFYSIHRITEKGPQIWEEYFTAGKLSIPEYSKEEKFVRIKIEGLNLCPAFCRDLEGYFRAIIGMVVPASQRKCQEKKCPFWGNQHHEFLATWE